ncbi:mycothiol synthase [Rhodococcus sp. WB1]|uniref:Mycothiol acetyltransferase n=1 Tax=Rhodococcus aetherivorans TaxID=191292 RepID=A0AA46SD51_9NOCA|nr:MULTISPECIES: mycothiol synthase [Rhodococcus]AKE88741.1 mycothiol acetyltransferase [Rhodococcus aetherivorans]ANZ26578.1 mycothiol synthase [Rhodococcus sp. WB1]QIX49157.1 mycothiol synthase [Rhodococcus sp. DMU1]UGQ40371.1 mycothiol synthase [Rhodococcus aetherivorans]USC16424.1 mycothiol synthase [Rhodococcus sp. 11-3]
MEFVSRLSAEQAAEVRALVARAHAADGTAPVSEQVLHSLTGDGDVRHLVAVDAAAIVGYANLVPGHGEHPAMAEVVVDPPHRRRGVGSRLVAAALDAGGAGTRVWAHGDLESARALAARLGLTPVRELLQLRRPLGEPELPALQVPDGLILRTYRGPEDDAELLRVNAAAFAWHPEQGRWTERDVAQRRSESWFDPAGVFLAFDEQDPDRLLGFHWTKVHAATADQPAIGEVYVVGIDPGAQGRGLGRLLTLAGLRYLRERGLGAVLLYVEGDNDAALRTYGRLGFERFHVDLAYARA